MKINTLLFKGALLVAISMPLAIMYAQSDPTLPPNWSQFGRNLKNWRNAPAETILNRNTVPNLQHKWDSLGIINPNDVSAVDGILYGTDLAGHAYALDAITGVPIWGPVHLISSSLFLAPAVGKTTVYTCSQNGFLFALDRATGAVLPSYPININTNPTSPVTSVFFTAVVLLEEEDLLFIATAGSFSVATNQFGTVRALQASTGVQLWVYQTTLNPNPGQPNTGGPGVGIFGLPAIDTENGLLLIGTGQNYAAPVTPISDSLIALDYRNGGNLVWYHQFTNNDVGAYPTNDCYYSRGPIKDWDADGGPIILSLNTPCGNQPIVVVGDKKGNLYALERLTGTLLWTTVLTNPNPSGSFHGGVNSLGCTDGEVVYYPAIYTTDGLTIADFLGSNVATALFAVRAADGHILWRRDFMNGGTFGPVTYANGVVYYVSKGFLPGQASTFYAFNSKNGQTLFELQNEVAGTPETSLGGVTIYKGMAYYGFTPGIRALGL